MVITHKDMKLTADKAVVYLDTKDAEAFGNVTLYKDESVFKGERINYNFETGKGTVLKVTMEEGVGPWYGKGERADRIGENEFIMQRGYITTCDKEKPHYRIQAKRIKIFLDDKIVAKNIIFFLDDFPIMYFPYYSHPLNDNRPRVTVIPGRNKDWGLFVLTAWRYHFNENAQGRLHLDYRERRDFASGFDHKYRLTNPFVGGDGIFRVYYMNERPLADHPWKLPRELATDETHRYRVQLKHKWQMDNDTQALLEYHRLHDRLFTKDYFFNEYQKESQPESYFSLTRIRPNHTLNLYARKRTNRFFTVVEKLPEVKLDIQNQRIAGTRFYYKSEHSLANLNSKTADSEEDTDSNRADTYNELSYATKFPGWFDWIKFTPYAGTRQTLYSKDKTGVDRNFFRGILYSGFNMYTRFYRIFDIDDKILGVEINKLRHVINPRIEYNYIHRPTVQSSKVGNFDGIDSIGATNTYTFTLDNKLQTKWVKKGEGNPTQIVDLVYLSTSVDFYPHINAGTHPFSNITAELELRPKRWLTFSGDTSYNIYTADFETVNFDLAASGGDRWEVGLGSRYQRDVSTELTSDLSYTISPKWKIRAYNRLAFKKFGEDGGKKINNLAEQEYVITRDLHCWIGEFTYSAIPGRGETLWLAFRLKAFPEFPLIDFNTAYNQRKIGSQAF